MADLAAIEAEIEKLQERAGKLRAYLEVTQLYSGDREGVSKDDEPDVESDQPILSPDSPYFGKSLGKAAVAVLEQAGQPLTEAQIAKVLRDAGWNFVSADPPPLVGWALRDLNKRFGQVARMPDARWALLNQRPPHVAKSVAGLRAARDRGVQLGAPRKVTEEMEQQMQEMTAAGQTIDQIAAALGVSVITVKRYRRAAKVSEDIAAHDNG